MIYIMRHGQSLLNFEKDIHCYNSQDDLTTIGYNQAHQAGLWLQDKAITHIIASPRKQAQQTAKIIAKVLQIDEIITEDRLCEADCGNLENQTGDANWEIWETIHTRWKQGEPEAQYPQGENLRDAFARFSDALRIIAQYEQPLIISHGAITHSVIPLLCVNAAALQRVQMVSHTGFIVLERYGTSRYICKSWDLQTHLS